MNLQAFVIRKIQIALLVILIYILDWSDGCFIHEGLAACHQSCRTCATNSNCGDPNACTSCKPGEFKYEPSPGSKTFQCEPECASTAFQVRASLKTKEGEYFRCAIPKGFYKTKPFLRNETSDVATINNYLTFNICVIAFSSSVSLMTCCVAFACVKISKQRAVSEVSRKLDVERNLIQPADDRVIEQPIVSISNELM